MKPHRRILSKTPEAQDANEKEWYRRHDYVRFNCPMPRALAAAIRTEAVRSGVVMHKMVGSMLAEALRQRMRAPEHASSAEELLG